MPQTEVGALTPFVAERAALAKIIRLRELAEDPYVRDILDLDQAFVGQYQPYSFFDYLDSSEALLRRIIPSV